VPQAQVSPSLLKRIRQVRHFYLQSRAFDGMPLAQINASVKIVTQAGLEYSRGTVSSLRAGIANISETSFDRDFVWNQTDDELCSTHPTRT
jgi:hypothetical protein